jgi:hypothetical protein
MLSEYELRVLREIEADLEGPPTSSGTRVRTWLRWLGAVLAVLWAVVIALLGVFVDLLAALVAAGTSLIVLAGSTPQIRHRIRRVWQRQR